MSLFEWFGLKRGDSRRRAAEARELAGDLAGAVELYVEAGMPDDAARVLLLRADAERSVEKRIAFCATASRTAESPELKRAALGRKALLAFDLVRARGASAMRSEVLAVARDLEAAGELERAADAFALVGDTEAETRVLAAAGAIDRLEERLRASMTAERDQRELAAALRKIADLDRVAERREAIAVAEAWLGGSRDGERVAEALRAIRARLLTGPLLTLDLGGAVLRGALGDEVTIGRGEATLVVANRAVSRTHVRIRRGPSGIEVEDLGTRNGTTLAGARLTAPLPVGRGVQLLLGGEVPCAIAPGTGQGCVVELAGERFVAPLGDLPVGPWRIRLERAGAAAFVVLKTPPGAPPPFLGDYQLAPSVELCAGDAISAARGGTAVFRLPAAGQAPPSRHDGGGEGRPA
ncbi:FHA domain-containing protein [Sorangium sp. So ce1389]|uniref:FHA domain-containing protein n=1 Tax=Sorangium sp. So ce1389 TaxID=3133336 RepID=UPI003F5E30B3